MKVATITLFYTLEFFSFGDDTIFVGCMPWVNFCLSFFEKNKNVLWSYLTMQKKKTNNKYL